GHQSPIPPSPSASPLSDWFAPGGHRLVSRPALNVLSQRPCRSVAVFRPGGHGLLADSLQRPIYGRVKLPRRRELAPLYGAQQRAEVVAPERCASGQQAVERGTERVHVRARAEPVE